MHRSCLLRASGAASAPSREFCARPPANVLAPSSMGASTRASAAQRQQVQHGRAWEAPLAELLHPRRTSHGAAWSRREVHGAERRPLHTAVRSTSGTSGPSGLPQLGASSSEPLLSSTDGEPTSPSSEFQYDEESKTLKMDLNALAQGQQGASRRTRQVTFTCNKCSE
jgi:hypothetical protein